MEKKPRKPKKKSAIQFSVDRDPEKRDNGLDAIIKATKMSMGLPSLEKSVSPLVKTSEANKNLQKNKIVYSSDDNYNSQNGIQLKGWKRIADVDQKEICQLDPYISAMVSHRAGQGAIIARESESKFDKGTRMSEKEPLNKMDFETEEEYEAEVKRRRSEMRVIMKWFQSCGDNTKETLDSVFGNEEPIFKKCSLADFVVSQIRNLMSFGRMGTHIIRDEDGVPILFRPAPIETIAPLIDMESTLSLSNRDPDTEGAKQSDADVAEWNALAPEERPAAWVQIINNNRARFFTEEDLRVDYFQKQALFDLNGYPLSPVEMAIYMVYTHQETLQFLRNSFIKGLATKGILTISSRDPNIDISQEDLNAIRRDFHNYVTRNENSATAPVIGGPFDIAFVPLSQTPKDMEFLQLEDHIIRALCSAFQVSPYEMGYGHLAQGQGGMSDGSRMEELLKGEEKGLRMLLDIIYDALNEILYLNFPEARDLYALTYTGVGEDSRDVSIQRAIQELNTTATMSSLFADSEKKDTVPLGGDVPLSTVFHQSVVRYMFYGDFMEKFFHMDGASKVPEFRFIIDPALHQSFMANQQMVAQQQMAQQQPQEAPQEDLSQTQDHTPDGSQQEQPAQEAPVEQPVEEPIHKSLREAFLEKQKLRKSLNYFSEWIEAQKD